MIPKFCGIDMTPNSRMVARRLDYEIENERVSCHAFPLHNHNWWAHIRWPYDGAEGDFDCGIGATPQAAVDAAVKAARDRIARMAEAVGARLVVGG